MVPMGDVTEQPIADVTEQAWAVAGISAINHGRIARDGARLEDPLHARRTASVKENQRPAFGMLVPLMLTIVITRIAGSLVFPTYDDAFITYRYARNLVHGIGFVYNRGEQILGVTAPLFAAVPALLELLHVPVPLGMLLVNICCDVVSLYLVSRLIDLRRSALMLMLFGLLLAVSPVLVRIAVGGMEANLFIVLFLTAIVLITRDWIACGLFVAVCACWMRPEGLMLLAVVSLYSLWQQPRRTLIAQFF